MLPDAERKAEPYVKEERKTLVYLIDSIPKLNEKNFIVVGSGTLWYIELAFGKVKTYVAVEPLADIFIQKQVQFILNQHKDVKVINKDFGEFKLNEIPNINSLYVFHFNILAYILHPIRSINMYLKEGDIIYISSWNRTLKAKQARKKYFDFVNNNTGSNSFKIDPEKTTGLCNLDVFPFNRLKYYKKHKRIKGEITDILIIYC